MGYFHLTLIYAAAAFLSAFWAAATLITGILFFTKGERYGRINDISSIFQMVFMLPLLLVFVQTAPAELALLAVLFTLVGLTGLLLAGWGQLLLVLRRIDFETSTKYFPAGGGIGIWLIGVSVIAMAAGLLPTLLAWIGITIGAGYLITIIGFLRGGQSHPLFSLGALLLGAGYPVWAIWLGVLLAAG